MHHLKMPQTMPIKCRHTLDNKEKTEDRSQEFLKGHEWARTAQNAKMTLKNRTEHRNHSSEQLQTRRHTSPHTGTHCATTPHRSERFNCALCMPGAAGRAKITKRIISGPRSSTRMGLKPGEHTVQHLP